MKKFPHLSPQAERLLVQLTEAAADAPRLTPCQREPAPFMSDERAVRAAAARACTGCPVRGLCAEYAAAAGERFGVWGGEDRTR